jgi:hypothetical protein
MVQGKPLETVLRPHQEESHTEVRKYISSRSDPAMTKKSSYFFICEMEKIIVTS